MKKKWNYFYNLLNALVLHSNPVSITHFVTESCNARCPHCFVDFKNIENEITLEQIEKIASTSGAALRNVSLTGGEPFLRNDFFEIADIWYKNSTAQSIAVCTNGSMPDRIEDFCKRADKENLPISFFFSYDYIGEKHSEYRHLKNLHENVLKSYEIVHKYYPKFNGTFNLTVTPDNFDSAFETYLYIRDNLNIQNINCTLVRGNAVKMLDANVKQGIAQSYQKIHSAMDKDFEFGKIEGFSDKSLTSVLLNAKNKMLWKYVLKTFNENKYISPCTAGSLFGVIYSRGDVFPCELLSSKIGNLADFDYDYSKCWHSQNAKKICNCVKNSKCFCTFECSWLLNIFSSPRYYFELLSCIINDINSKRGKNV